MFELASLPQDMGQIVVQGIALGRLAFRRLFMLSTCLAFLSLLPTAVMVWGASDETSFNLMDPSAFIGRLQGPYGWTALAMTLAGFFPLAVLLQRLAIAASGQQGVVKDEWNRALKLWPWMVLAFFIYVSALCLGMILLFIPALILLFSLMFVEYVVVLEGKRPMEALNISHHLVWGHWWRTVGMVLLIYLPLFIAESVLGAMLGIGSGAHDAVHGRDIFAQEVLNMVFLAVCGPFIYSILFLYYHDLKLRKQQR